MARFKKDSNSRVYAPVDPVYRIPDVTINPSQLVERSLTKFEQFEADRSEWISRREEFYLSWDDYISPIRKGPWDGSSNFHLPMTEIQCNLMHARLMQAFFFIEPWFFVDPQEEIDLARVHKIELMMKYILKRYVNYNDGIYNAIDDWCWDIVTEGMGILSRDWHIVNRRFIDVERNEDFQRQKVDLQRMLDGSMDEADFAEMAKDFIKQPYIEKSVIKNAFNGPVVRAENPIYILFQGSVPDSSDLNLHETVIKVCYFSKDELLSFAQQKLFDEDVVEDIINDYPTSKKGNMSASTRGTRVEYMKDRITGVRTVDTSLELQEYEFYCVYDRVCLEKDGNKARYNDELVYFVHPSSRKLARWTYLDRVIANGKKPLHLAHLYRRPRRTIGRGIVETQFPLNDMADLLINQSIDAGTLANNPMFGFRGNSTFDPQEVRVEPGLGLRMDDPNNDLRFFNWNVNPNWSSNIQGLVQSFSQQLTTLGPLAAGQVGNNVGPLRSNAGAQTLLSEMNTNLDIVINRAKAAYSQMMEGLYSDCIDRMPDKMKITVLGPDGEPQLNDKGVPELMEVSREELKTRVHFGLYANSQNMNRAAQQQAAMVMAQFLLQPIGMQTGVVQPKNIYEIYMNVIKAMGIQQPYRFLSKPKDMLSIPLQAEMWMIMQGITPPVVLNDPDHGKKLDFMTSIDREAAKLESQYGHVSKEALKILDDVIQKHKEFFEVINAPTNLKNPTGSNQSPTLGAQDTMMPEGMEQGAPEGGDQQQAPGGATPQEQAAPATLQ